MEKRKQKERNLNQIIELVLVVCLFFYLGTSSKTLPLFPLCLVLVFYAKEIKFEHTII